MATHFSILAWRIPMDRRTWRAAVHRVVQNWPRLKQLSTHAMHTILSATLQHRVYSIDATVLCQIQDRGRWRLSSFPEAVWPVEARPGLNTGSKLQRTGF